MTIADFDRQKEPSPSYSRKLAGLRGIWDCWKLEIPSSTLSALGQIEIEDFGKVICVGGGVGVAPVYPITRALYEAGNHVVSIIGARNRELLILEEEMRKVSHQLVVMTDDGSYGEKGFVTDALRKILSQDTYARVIAIGPLVMMKAVSQVTKEFGVKTIVSLNPIMVDGTGMCGACRVEVGGETRFACVDGPEFDGHQVDWIGPAESPDVPGSGENCG